jgi:hypothetical protein
MENLPMCRDLCNICTGCCIKRPCSCWYCLFTIGSILLWGIALGAFIFAMVFITWNEATCIVDDSVVIEQSCESCEKGVCHSYTCNTYMIYFTIWYNDIVFNTTLSLDSAPNLSSGNFTCCTDGISADIVSSDCNHLMYKILVPILAGLALGFTIFTVLLSYRIIACGNTQASI